MSADVIPYRAPTEQPGSPPTAAADAARDLCENVAALQALLRQFVELADRKLAAMRAGQAGALQECAAREDELLGEIECGHRRRQAALARLAQALRAPHLARARLSDVPEYLPEPSASLLRVRNAALQQIAATLQQKNRLAAQVAQHLQMHLRAVFAEVAKANQESVVYGPQGQHRHSIVRSCLDAMG